MIRQKGARSSIGSTPDQTLEQTHATVVAITGSVKNAQDANIYLQTKGWIIAGEAISLETLARTLFATVLEQKLPPRAANAITAVAFLLTEQLEESVTQEAANSLVKHIRETISSLTTQEVANTIKNNSQSPSERSPKGFSRKWTTIPKQLRNPPRRPSPKYARTARLQKPRQPPPPRPPPQSCDHKSKSKTENKSKRDKSLSTSAEQVNSTSK